VLTAATIITAVTGATLRLLLSDKVAALVAIAAGLLSARAIFGWELARYQQRMLQQMPDLIELVVSATRAGLPASEAFAWVARDAQSPTREEFSRVVSEISLGRTPEQALMDLHRRTKITEYAIFAVTLAVQMRSGGRLAESIENLAATIRQRLSIGARARALAAESRLSARLLIAMPFIAGVAMTLMHHDYMAPLLFDPRGRRLLVGSAVSLVIGALAMRRLIKGATAE
jgi:tight adherence protein B